MNLAALTEFVCTKGQMVGTADIAAAKLFLAKRYELIWNSYLWKDSLVMVDVTVDPDNADNAEGIVLMPEIIDRVVAIRTADRSVKVTGLETFYREDFDKFASHGTPYEFAILSPVWFIWRGTTGLQVQAQEGVTVKLVWRNSEGVKFDQNLALTDAQAALLNANQAANGQEDTNVVVLSGAGSAVANGTYTFDGEKYVGSNGLTIENLGGVWTVVETGDWLYTAASPDGPYAVSDSGIAPAPASSYGTKCRIEIEAMFKPVTTNAVAINPQHSYNDAGGSLAAASTRSPSYQRVRLFYIPQVETTLKVLGKRKCSALTFDQEEPEIRNLENCLIAFALGDLWARRRQMGKANQFYQEGTALLKELAKLETMQAAHNSRFIPDAGAGDPFFGPGRSSGFWI